jgi:hypothetical protein
MSFKKLAVVTLASLVLAALPLLAGDAVPANTASAKVETAKGPETAVFAIPGLKDEALVKNLNSALAKEGGIMAAKADAEHGKFMVTFEPGKTNPETLGKALAKVSPEAKFEKVQAADPAAAKHDCSKCPSKSTCGKHK